MKAPRRTLDLLEDYAADCRNCELWRDATQTVFGAGAARADLMLVGEQPGDREDRVGEPFVGPAGRILDGALEDAGIDRGNVYVTNIVKHFRFEQRGKKRLHKKPRASEIKACRPWLDGEIEVVNPKLIVCLGSTAAQALLGSDFRVTKHRGEVFRPDGLPATTATVHPSAVLRAPTDAERHQAQRSFARDIARAVEEIGAA